MYEGGLAYGEYKGEMTLMLNRKPNGDCIFLGPAGCKVYDRRPATCQNFDCRRIVMAIPSAGRQARAVKDGLFSEEIFEAGRQRLATLVIHPSEEKIYKVDADGGTPVGDYITGREMGI